MNEVRALVEAFDNAAAAGQKCALAILVSVEGSSYRRPGARMLIRENGDTSGTISAGCLEADLIEHANLVIKSQQAKLVEYNTSSTNDEIAWGLGLGCNGVVRVLVEPLAGNSLYIDSLRRSCGLEDTAVPMDVASVYDCEPGELGQQTSRVNPGTRLVFDESGECRHEGIDGSSAADLQLALTGQWKSSALLGANVVDLNGSIVRVFWERLLPPVPLVIFGAGPDVLPIVELARSIGWQTEVVDTQHRPVSASRFAVADKVTLARPEDVAADVQISPRTMTVVMTHNYEHDLQLLGFLLDSPASYIGVMGPRKRTERMLNELRPDRKKSSLEFRPDRLHSPVGLDIGANGPMEIALSIIGEMTAILNGREGGLLRNKLGSIHGKPSDAEPLTLTASHVRFAESADAAAFDS